MVEFFKVILNPQEILLQDKLRSQAHVSKMYKTERKYTFLG